MAGREREPQTKFGRMLRGLRRAERPRVAQDAMARRLEISAGMYGRYERGYVVPPPETVEAMATAFGADVQAWLVLAGYGDAEPAELGAIVSDSPVSYHGERDDFPVLGSIADHGVVSYEPDDPTLSRREEGGESEKGGRMYRLVVQSATVGGALDVGDEVVIDPDAAPRRNARVIVREADGTCRLVRYISASRQSPEVLRVEPLDAAKGLVKSFQLEGASVLGVLVRWTSKHFQ